MSQEIVIYQVSELVSEMRRLMETSYPEIWIEGEISSLSTPASGHLYFTLKDEQSQLRCAMFRSRVGVCRYTAKSGDLVRIRAKISVYSARGELQCIVQYIEDAGEGVLQRRFEELKVELSNKGLFDASHKLNVPKFPAHIGLITSPTGAAVKDVLTTLSRRCANIPITIYPAVVQGDGAGKTLIQAISDVVAHRRCDVIILARGGGSIEDLWCFNDAALAAAIYQCPIPIISAVGHEVDITIADFVSDLRAPTPTAAAELISPDNDFLKQQIKSLSLRLRLTIARYFEKRGQDVDLSFQQLRHPLAEINSNQKLLLHVGIRLNRAIHSDLRGDKQLLENSVHRLNTQSPSNQLANLKSSIGSLSLRLQRGQAHTFESIKQNFSALASQLHLVSPLATLERGFSIARDNKGEILLDSQSSNLGDELTLKLKSGMLLCKIQEIME